jgi:hypothetical protein
MNWSVAGVNANFTTLPLDNKMVTALRLAKALLFQIMPDPEKSAIFPNRAPALQIVRSSVRSDEARRSQ